MADRSTIRSMYALVDAMYDAFLVSGLAYLTYKAFERQPRRTANEGQALVVHRGYLKPRIVHPNSTSYFAWQPKKVDSVPYFYDQVLNISMSNHKDNMIEFKTRVQLHAIDQAEAAQKYGSDLKRIQVNKLQQFFRSRGKKMIINEKNQAQIRKKIDQQMQVWLNQQQFTDRNVLREIDLIKISQVNVGKRIVPQML